MKGIPVPDNGRQEDTGNEQPIIRNPLFRVVDKNALLQRKGVNMYERNIDLMDESVFPRQSIYLAKENPNRNSSRIPREEKSDEEIVRAVSAEMINSLGEGLEP